MHTNQAVQTVNTKIDQNTAASSSRFHEQSVVLQRVETYTEASLARSLTSDRSLQSIASSLSRIEAMASSVASVSGLPPGNDTTGSRPHPRIKRRSTGGVPSTRRKSGSSVRSIRHSNASVSSLPTIPTIPENVRTSEISGETQDRSSSCRETQTPWTSIFTDPKALSAHLSGLAEATEQPDCISKGTQTLWTSEVDGEKHVGIDDFLPIVSAGQLPITNSYIDTPLHQQHQLFHPLTQSILATMYPSVVIEYIAMAQIIRDYKNKIDILNLLNFESGIDESKDQLSQEDPKSNDLYVLRQERDALRSRQTALAYDLQTCRRRCIFEGHYLYDIESRLGLIDNMGHANRQNITTPDSGGSRFCNVLAKEIQNHKSSLLGGWSNSRDRVNCWLLHCMQSDEEQVHVQRSMLADPPTDDRYWARQVLLHWFIDESATGEDLQISQSVSAVGSHTIGSSNYLFHNGSYWNTRKLNEIHPEPAPRNKGRRLRHAPSIGFRQFLLSKAA